MSLLSLQRIVSTSWVPGLRNTSSLLATRCSNQWLRHPNAHRCISSATLPEFPRSFRRRSANKMKHPEGKSCSTCGAQESAGKWRKNPEENDAMLCGTCYQRLRRARNNLSNKVCSDCGSRKSPDWYRHPVNREVSLCLRCHRIRKLEHDKVHGKTCRGCGTKETGCWHRHPDEKGASLCSRCHRIDQLARDRLAGRSCRDCGTKETWEWRVHPSGDGTSLCGKCYHRGQYLPRTALVDMKCHQCGTGSSYSHRWLRSSDDNSPLCYTCWQRDYRAKKRAARLTAKESAN